jgi:cell division protein DivIC
MTGKEVGRPKTGLTIAHMMLLLAIPVLVYLAFSAGRKVIEMVVLRQQAAELRQEIEQLKARNAALREQIAYLQSDAYVEKVAREDLGLVKPGDTPVAVVMPSPSATPTPTPTPTPAPWWRQPLDRAKGIFR